MTVSKSGGVKVSSFTLCVLYSRPSALPFLCILIFKVVPGCSVHWDVQDVQGGLGVGVALIVIYFNYFARALMYSSNNGTVNRYTDRTALALKFLL